MSVVAVGFLEAVFRNFRPKTQVTIGGRHKARPEDLIYKPLQSCNHSKIKKLYLFGTRIALRPNMVVYSVINRRVSWNCALALLSLQEKPN